MIRNHSLAQIFKNNTGEQSAAQFKELCYGKGYAMVDGKMVKLGLCTMDKKKVPRSPTFQDNASAGTFWGKCVNKKNA